MENISLETFQKFTRTEFIKLSPSFIEQLSDEQVSWITNQQLLWLTVEQIQKLRVECLTLEQLKSFVKQFIHVTSINNFTQEKLQSLNLNQIRSLTPLCLENSINIHNLFTSVQLTWLSSNKLQFLALDLKLLTTEQLGVIGRSFSFVNNLSRFTVEQLKNLTVTQIKFLTPKCLEASDCSLLTNEQLNALSSLQFKSLKLKNLTTEQFASLTRMLLNLDSLSLLSEEQVKSLTKKQLANISVKCLEKSIEQYSLLSKEQLTYLSTTQLIVMIKSLPNFVEMLDTIDGKLVQYIDLTKISLETFNKKIQCSDQFNGLVTKYLDIQKISNTKSLTISQILNLNKEQFDNLITTSLSLKQISLLPLDFFMRFSFEQLGYFCNEQRGAFSEEKLLYYMDKYWNADNTIVEELEETIESVEVIKPVETEPIV